MLKYLSFVICTGVLLLCASAAWACTVPVYRYALERWPADIYQVTVFHSGPLSEQAAALVTRLHESSYEYDRAANYLVETVDVANPLASDLQDLWNSFEAPEMPWVVVRYPEVARYQGTIWAGCLCAKSVQAIIDSPARREVGRRILNDGNAAVWVLVESGNAAEDAAAETFIAEQLARLNDLLAEEKDEFDADRAAFSLLRIARADPQEEVFIAMLMHCEPGLFDFASYPIVFPIFGRGRALYALAGSGITERNMALAADFMTGSCSCQVKEENPGTDLLMILDWEGGITEYVTEDEDAIPLVGSSTLISLGEETETPEASGAAQPDAPPLQPTSNAVVRNIVVTLGLLTLIAVVGTALISLKPAGKLKQ